MHERLIHDAAWAIATALDQAISPALPEDERESAFGVFYTAARAGIEAYEVQLERMQQRLHPSKN